MNTILNRFKTLIFGGMLVVIGWQNSTWAGSCENVFVVLPPGQDGGTFYLSESTYKREGYLPKGTLLSIDRKYRRGEQCGGFKYARCTTDHGSKVPYLKFTASNGYHGWVRQSEAKRIKQWFQDYNGQIQCDGSMSIVVPRSAIGKGVPIFRLDVTPNGKQARSENPITYISRTSSLPVTISKDAQPLQIETSGVWGV